MQEKKEHKISAMQALAQALAGYNYSEKAQGFRLYEKENIFRLYLNAEQALALGLQEKRNKQGFISLNKASEKERKAWRALVEQARKESMQ